MKPNKIKRAGMACGLAVVCVAWAGAARAAFGDDPNQPPGQVDGQALLRADEKPNDWLMYHQSYNRGIAAAYGNIYVGTVDGRVIAIDAKTGKEVWDTQVVGSEESNKGFTAPR